MSRERKRGRERKNAIGKKTDLFLAINDEKVLIAAIRRIFYSEITQKLVFGYLSQDDDDAPTSPVAAWIPRCPTHQTRVFAMIVAPSKFSAFSLPSPSLPSGPRNVAPSVDLTCGAISLDGVKVSDSSQTETNRPKLAKLKSHLSGGTNSFSLLSWLFTPPLAWSSPSPPVLLCESKKLKNLAELAAMISNTKMVRPVTGFRYD